MYVAPDSNIKILRNVPLDPTYDHTVYFNNVGAQYAYFASLAKYSLTSQSYQRTQRGWMRVNMNAENLYDCNYVMYQNHAFGNKWFYAFIKSVEYVNNAVSEVQFEIDVMQTWHFNYTLDACFVEREHSATDNLYEHIIEENLEVGDEYFCKAHDTFDMNTMYICILANRKTSGSTAVSVNINGVYTPLHIVAGVPVTDTSTIDALLDAFNENEIVAVYQYPGILGDATTTSAYTGAKQVTAQALDFNGYIPKNKKLYNYPYCGILVSNNSGQTAMFRWEDWTAGTGTFAIKGVFISTPAVICYPQYYRGITSAYDEGLVFSNFPQCPWSGDTFKTWWAQNKNSFVTAGITSMISTAGGAAAMIGAGAATFPAVTAAAATISVGATVARSVAKVQDLKNTPAQTHGQVQTDVLNPATGRLQFDFYQMQIKKEYAKIIDEYFDRYGYATKRNKKPNRNVRPHWCYTKTIGCTITGSIPCDDATKICNIYNNGITFWMNGSEVGNYSLDNTV